MLLAMGLSEADAHYALRFSLPPGTREGDLERTLEPFGRVLTELRETARFLPCK